MPPTNTTMSIPFPYNPPAALLVATGDDTIEY